MVDERQERVQIERGQGFERRRRVVAYSPSMQRVLVARFNRLIWLLTAVVEVFILFRFVLKLIAANPANGFASFVYAITDVLVAPFSGLVNSPAAANGSIVDVASLFAIVVYLVLAWIVTRLITIVFASPGGSRQVTTIERHD